MTRKSTNGNVRGRLSDGTPNPVDIHVGSRVRMRRTILGLSQERLADELGITFQQVQKYERGLNRIGASRLWDLSQVLDVPVEFFYGNLDENACNQSPRKIISDITMAEDTENFKTDFLMRKDVLTLIRYYLRIKDAKVAKNIVDLVRSLSPKDPDDEEMDED